VTQFNNSIHGLRGRQEHVHMMWGDTELKTDSSGCEYIEFHEEATTTRQGSTRYVRAVAPKMYSAGLVKLSHDNLYSGVIVTQLLRDRFTIDEPRAE